MKKYYSETYREIITMIFWIPPTNLWIQACVFVAKTTGVAEPLNFNSSRVNLVTKCAGDQINLYPRSFKLILVHGPPTVQLDLKWGDSEKTVQPIKTYRNIFSFKCKNVHVLSENIHL